MDKLDQRLLALLSENGRESVTVLAQKLSVSRATVQERMRRLEKQQVIQGYTIRFAADYLNTRVVAHVLIATDQKQPAQLNRQIEKIPAVKALYSISGEYDIFAVVQEETTADLDRQIDRLAELEGVRRTLTSVVLSKKFER
ncbi:Lrp/AsnC family transcriptional regulator [Exilibacterium tricleocarpae]|uniref:Lrp/AsnC family transcriptional regulator n=1 Tax=Exilibacterium tricleocarpae TaxID=2591008 RepID=A0A545U5V0_9GAMM|nr:Lrp/AsnC family transcriptional regulator [Exilibacterium tricleocarpae]TQV84783.1 Lrp/AsnC family transcriptional regulator [Exilibacterium tricleocarpae]